ncbi:flagellar protein FliT [Burkholderia seminalis]|uniref:flagellar protein FliT n=1 Tax=Burkholderia seminalis TaxID=488731 RepID=UPI001905326E|nr:flagellar protein FliT [Burkholderia seminalis]MBJ9591189.1 flagellar protein FliT [Burkholderia seminalis]
MTTDALNHALHLTHAMQSASALRDWERVAALAGARSPLLMSLAPEQTPAALDTIRRIMDIDASITQDAQADRDRLAQQFTASRERIRAASAYQTTGML